MFTSRRVIWVIAPLALILAIGVIGRSDAKTAPKAHAGSGIGATSSTQSPAGPSTVAAVTISSFQFSPVSVTVKVGGTVTWTNQDGFDHSISDKAHAFKGPGFGTGAPYAHRYDKVGTFPYFCGIHNSMVGTVVVVP